MPATQINITVSVPPFPENTKMNPSQFAEWLAENMQFSASGAFLGGQIGGPTPSTNVGLYVTNGKIQYWDGAKYATTLTVPIGAMLPFPSSNLAVPDSDWLFCDGSLLLKTDFPLLFAAIGTAWNAAGDDATNYFRLPNTAGRVHVGSGVGNYNPTNDATIPSGNMVQRNPGDYFGYEWPTYRQSLVNTPNSPIPRYYYVPYNSRAYNGKFFTGVSQPAFVCPFIIRAK